MTSAIAATDLACRYGRHEAVHDVSFSVRPGSLFALLGPNGAGKTTIIRVLVNMLRPHRGGARVLGVDSGRLGPAELRRIGYVSENQQLPGSMTVSDLLAYCRPFYPDWDDAFARKLSDLFELPAGVKIRHLSRGMRVKAALVSTLAYRPRVLILDEPFSGLDPVVRDDLVRGVLELAGEQQWSVLISSHDLDEVERLVDEVGFINDGRLLLTEPLGDLQRRFRAVDVTLDAAPDSDVVRAAADRIPATSVAGIASGRLFRFVETRYDGAGSEQQVRQLFPGAHVETRGMTLREIFIALARHERGRTGEAPR